MCTARCCVLSYCPNNASSLCAGKLVPVLENASVHCSVLCLLVISVERYLAICRPLRAARRRDVRLPLVAATWTLAALTAAPFALLSDLKHVGYTHTNMLHAFFLRASKIGLRLRCS